MSCADIGEECHIVSVHTVQHAAYVPACSMHVSLVACRWLIYIPTCIRFALGFGIGASIFLSGEKYV